MELAVAEIDLARGLDRECTDDARVAGERSSGSVHETWARTPGAATEITRVRARAIEVELAGERMPWTCPVAMARASENFAAGYVTLRSSR